jgi:hypothetical protein
MSLAEIGSVFFTETGETTVQLAVNNAQDSPQNVIPPSSVAFNHKILTLKRMKSVEDTKKGSAQ